MKNLYYVVKKQLEDIDGFEETTGWKTITIYDIDTQCMNIIIVGEIEVPNSLNSENEIQTWLDNNEDDKEYNFIEL